MFVRLILLLLLPVSMCAMNREKRQEACRQASHMILSRQASLSPCSDADAEQLAFLVDRAVVKTPMLMQ